MKFEELHLPESVPSEGLSTVVKRALKIYSQIDPSGYLNLDKHSAQNEVLDMFDTRLAYIATDDERIVQGIANYYPEAGKNYGWIEGLAATRGMRAGGFIVSSLVDLAKSQSLNAIELHSTQDALGFWVKQGFDTSAENTNDRIVRMRLEL